MWLQLLRRNGVYHTLRGDALALFDQYGLVGGAAAAGTTYALKKAPFFVLYLF